jgi:mono/diheme cytochrome c family protein/plastocyanin
MMKKNPEKLARLLLFGLLLGLGLAVIGARLASPASAGGLRVEMRALMPEAGGWNPDYIQAEVGQPIHLRFTSDDVVHGFAVGKQEWPSVDIYPGQWTESTLVFDKPGKYTYYCTRWCGPSHWRMRGIIEVKGPGSEEPSIDPLYVKLGIDIDAPRQAQFLPEKKPSARRGVALNMEIPSKFRTQAFYRANSPEQIWIDLRAEESFMGLNNQQVWDLVAVVWTEQVAPEKLALYEPLYKDSCAACHGESGVGEGVLAPLRQEPGATSRLQQSGDQEMASQREPSDIAGMEHAEGAMPDFNDPVRMLAASPALLQGKIIRGGMGTGMPYFGPILTEEQTWALVAYIQSFQFDME